MDEKHIEELLQENLRLSKENNKLLKHIRGNQRLANIRRVVYWMVLVVLIVLGYYSIQPYLKALQDAYDNIINAYQGVQAGVKSFGEAGEKAKEASAFFTR